MMDFEDDPTFEDDVREKLYNVTMSALTAAENIIKKGTPATRDRFVTNLFNKLLPLLGERDPDYVAKLEDKLGDLLAEVKGGGMPDERQTIPLALPAHDQE